MKVQISHGREKEFGQWNHEGRERRYNSVCWRTENLAQKNEKLFLKNMSLKAADILLFNPCAGATRQNPKEHSWRQQLLVLTQKFICTICYRNISQGEQGRHLGVSTQRNHSEEERNFSRGKGICQKWIADAVKRSKALGKDHQLAQSSQPECQWTSWAALQSAWPLCFHT